MSIWRTFDSPEDFDAWHEQAKAALGPRDLPELLELADYVVERRR